MAVSSAKKVSYAIAIPTNNNNIANIVLNSELSTFSPIFWPIWTPTIEPRIKKQVFEILTSEKSIEEKNSYGGTSKKQILNAIKRAKQKIKNEKKIV